MKQIITILFSLLIAGGAWFYFQGSNEDGSLAFNEKKNTPHTVSRSTRQSSEDVAAKVKSPVKRIDLGSELDDGDEDLDEDFDEYDERPAAEVYASLELAIEAIKKGALDYDDIILEQFVEPGSDCTWCPELYNQITDMMLSEDANEDAKAYYSEILAISGKKENIETLVDAIRESTDEDNADILAESLELTIGGDDVVDYLSDFVSDDNELLQESAVAAVTNQGSKKAAEILYERALSQDDPNDDYDLGIGLGEMIPDEGTLPYLQDIVNKRDKYSQLGVKALLNYGHDGVVRS